VVAEADGIVVAPGLAAQGKRVAVRDEATGSTVNGDGPLTARPEVDQAAETVLCGVSDRGGPCRSPLFIGRPEVVWSANSRAVE
jgi:hypothetical protein